MQVNINDIKGEIAKQDERYTVIDNKNLKNLVLSSTKLQPNCATNGHFHVGQEEIYFFVDGSGKMELDEEIIHFVAGDVVQIPNGAFHKVSAGPLGAYFVCVFGGKRYE
jgi:quercetin dioxygenase-like cupin family protein